MTDRIFIDSNIWLYLFLKDSYDKYRLSEEFIIKNSKNSIFVISYQVVNEVSNKLFQKNFEEKIIRENIERMCKICTLQDFTKDILINASQLREKYSISFWDSIIVSSGIIANCNVLISEDLQDGMKIQNMEIRNIYKTK